MNAILYGANTSSQTVSASGTTINFGNIVRRYGKAINLIGGNVTVASPGYYNLDTNLTFTAGADGTVVVTMYQNGQNVTGVVASQTVASGSIYNISLPGMVRTYCCNPSNITFVVSGVAGTISNASVVAEKE